MSQQQQSEEEQSTAALIESQPIEEAQPQIVPKSEQTSVAIEQIDGIQTGANTTQPATASRDFMMKSSHKNINEGEDDQAVMPLDVGRSFEDDGENVVVKLQEPEQQNQQPLDQQQQNIDEAEKIADENIEQEQTEVKEEQMNTQNYGNVINKEDAKSLQGDNQQENAAQKPAETKAQKHQQKKRQQTTSPDNHQPASQSFKIENIMTQELEAAGGTTPTQLLTKTTVDQQKSVMQQQSTLGCIGQGGSDLSQIFSSDKRTLKQLKNAQQAASQGQNIKPQTAGNLGSMTGVMMTDPNEFNISDNRSKRTEKKQQGPNITNIGFSFNSQPHTNFIAYPSIAKGLTAPSDASRTAISTSNRSKTYHQSNKTAAAQQSKNQQYKMAPQTNNKYRSSTNAADYINSTHQMIYDTQSRNTTSQYTATGGGYSKMKPFIQGSQIKNPKNMTTAKLQTPACIMTQTTGNKLKNKHQSFNAGTSKKQQQQQQQYSEYNLFSQKLNRNGIPKNQEIKYRKEMQQLKFYQTLNNYPYMLEQQKLKQKQKEQLQLQKQQQQIYEQQQQAMYKNTRQQQQISNFNGQQQVNNAITYTDLLMSSSGGGLQAATNGAQQQVTQGPQMNIQQTSGQNNPSASLWQHQQQKQASTLNDGPQQTQSSDNNNIYNSFVSNCNYNQVATETTTQMVDQGTNVEQSQVVNNSVSAEVASGAAAQNNSSSTKQTVYYQMINQKQKHLYQSEFSPGTAVIGSAAPSEHNQHQATQINQTNRSGVDSAPPSVSKIEQVKQQITTDNTSHQQDIINQTSNSVFAVMPPAASSGGQGAQQQQIDTRQVAGGDGLELEAVSSGCQHPYQNMPMSLYAEMNGVQQTQLVDEQHHQRDIIDVRLKQSQMEAEELSALPTVYGTATQAAATNNKPSIITQETDHQISSHQASIEQRAIFDQSPKLQIQTAADNYGYGLSSSPKNNENDMVLKAMHSSHRKKVEEKDDFAIMSKFGQPELLQAKKVINLETGTSTTMRVAPYSAKPLNNAVTTTTALQPSNQNILGLNDDASGASNNRNNDIDLAPAKVPPVERIQIMQQTASASYLAQLVPRQNSASGLTQSQELNSMLKQTKIESQSNSGTALMVKGSRVEKDSQTPQQVKKEISRAQSMKQKKVPQSLLNQKKGSSGTERWILGNKNLAENNDTNNVKDKEDVNLLKTLQELQMAMNTQTLSNMISSPVIMHTDMQSLQEQQQLEIINPQPKRKVVILKNKSMEWALVVSFLSGGLAVSNPGFAHGNSHLYELMLEVNTAVSIIIVLLQTSQPQLPTNRLHLSNRKLQSGKATLPRALLARLQPLMALISA